jgi:hypothetical protein
VNRKDTMSTIGLDYQPDLQPLDLDELDAGIRPYVEVLRAAGVETFESCQGGPGHAVPDPNVRFHGEHSEGFRALAAALRHGLPVLHLNRQWTVEDGEPVGPSWEMVFSHAANGV